MILKRKIYDKLLDWKTKSKGKKAILIEGARRIGKSTVCEEFGENSQYKGRYCMYSAIYDHMSLIVFRV